MKLKEKHLRTYDLYCYVLLKIIFRILACIPVWLAEVIAFVISKLWYKSDRFHREIALDNLHIAFGNEKTAAEMKKIAKQSFYNTTNMLFESARSFRWDSYKIRKKMQIEGIEHIDSAQQKGKGTLLLTGHMGNWEMSVLIVDLIQHEIAWVYKKLKMAAAERFIIEKRTSRGGRMYAVKGSVAGILTELAHGSLMALLIDHNAKRRNVFVDFFGKVASTEKGLAQLALSTGAPVVPYFVIRRNREYIVEVMPEVPLIDTGNHEADIVSNTAQYTKIIENFIRKYPDQWLWIHRRWQTRPAYE